MRFVRSALLAAWPFLASLALGAVIVASVVSAATVLSQRDEYRRQSKVVEKLLVKQEEQAKGARERLALALAGVDEIIERRAYDHDEAARAAHQELLDQIAKLLGRPAGVKLDPVAATVATTTTVVPRMTPPRTTTTVRPATTTTTTPCRKKC